MCFNYFNSLFLFILLFFVRISYLYPINNNNNNNSTTIRSRGCSSCNSYNASSNYDEEVIKSERIIRRLEYVKQTLFDNIRPSISPHMPNKFKSIPKNLLNQLINPNNDYDNANSDQVPPRQLILFSEKETGNVLDENNGWALEFDLTNEFFTAEIYSAQIWINKDHFISNGALQSFIISDSPFRKPMNKSSFTHLAYHTDGWFQLDVKDIVQKWQETEEKEKTVHIYCVTCVKTQNQTHFNETTNSKFQPFLFLSTDSQEISRSKRGVDCSPGATECCREDLVIDVRSLGYEYRSILHPTKFNTYYCRGNCYNHSFTLANSPYASLLATLRIKEDAPLPSSCCTPTVFSDLFIFYASSNNTFERKLVPNMIVESCGCI